SIRRGRRRHGPGSVYQGQREDSGPAVARVVPGDLRNGEIGRGESHLGLLRCRQRIRIASGGLRQGAAEPHWKCSYCTTTRRVNMPTGLPDSNVGTFTQALYDEAKSTGWTVISMKNDCKRIFAFEQEAGGTTGLSIAAKPTVSSKPRLAGPHSSSPIESLRGRA